MATTSSKRSKNTCFSVAHGLASFLRKVIFLPLLDPVDPFGHPTSLPQPSGPRYWCLGVRLGNSEGWKPQKVGGCGWTRCPRNRILSHVAKDMAYSWFVAVGIWSFCGLFGPFPGHIMELEGRKELVDTGKSSRTWNVPTVPLHLTVLNGFQGFFGPKMAIFGPKLQLLKPRSATCESRSRPPPLSFLLKLCVIVLHTHRYHPPKFHPNPKHHDGVLIFSHFARAACCLLACLLACCC